MKRVFALILLLTVALLPGCGGAESRPAAASAPTDEPAPSARDVADEIGERLSVYGECDVYALDTNENGQYEFSMHYDDSIVDAVIADYIQAYSTLVRNSGVPFESVSLSMHQDGTKYQKLIDWDSEDGVTGSLRYMTVTLGADGKPDVSTMTLKNMDDVTFENVVAEFGTAGLEFDLG